MAFAALAVACSSSSPPAQTRYPVGYYPPPPPQQVAKVPAAAPKGATSWLDALGMLQSALPCPIPGLPPALTTAFDCASMRSIANAVPYTPRALMPGQLPAAVDHRTMGLTGPVKDQAQVGACAGFALSSVMDTAARRMGRNDVVSPLHIFSKYTGHGLHMLKGLPITSEPVWAYDPAKACQFASAEQASGCDGYYHVQSGSARNNPQLMGEQSRADMTGYYRIDAFEDLSKQDLDQVAALLADGEAVWAAVDFYRPAWQDASIQKTGYLPYYPDGDGLGHGVTLQGYRQGPNGREFLFQNSWGADWGQGGYAWIPESMLHTHLLYAYRLRVSPASAPAPVACAPGSPTILGVCVPTGGGGVPSIPGLPSIPGVPSIPGLWPSGAPSAVPTTMPSGLPSLPTCPSGSVPNPLTGQCFQMPSGG